MNDQNYGHYGTGITDVESNERTCGCCTPCAGNSERFVGVLKGEGRLSNGRGLGYLCVQLDSMTSSAQESAAPWLHADMRLLRTSLSAF